tara:strand:+ start:19276 stop:19653 length:378 start_codon:yes stop_codon:yes gene_type:complete
MQNLQTFSSARDWDQIEAYASTISGALVYWENPRLELANADAKKIVLDYYKIDEEIPTDLAITLDGNYYGYIEFRDSTVAFDFVTDYFPRKDEVSDDTYWYHCYVVRPDGVIEYDNDALRKGNNV